MAKRGRRPSLTALEQRKADLDTQIKALKREERKKAGQEERERFSILGRALAKALASDPDLAAQLEPVINAHVTKASDRKRLNLSPLEKAPPSAGQ